MTAPSSASPDAADRRDEVLNVEALAQLGHNETVRVMPIPDATSEAFDQTLAVIDLRAEHGEVAGPDDAEALAAPRDGDLRTVYKFASILGGYDAFNDLTRSDSPTIRLIATFREVIKERDLTSDEIGRLEDIHHQLKQAVDRTRQRYRETHFEGLTTEEIKELHALVSRARDMANEVNLIIGENLMKQIRQAVERLNVIRLKALGVERSVSGIFLVDDEVMYIPEEELAASINTIFRGVGNPHLANNIDGVLLLAARNVLIEVVSFYAYYGKHQIYQLFKVNSAVDRQRVTLRIRNEIRKILRACKEDNKLVLTRVMAKEEERLDMSIEAIMREAEKSAVEAVIRILPPEAPPPPPRKKKWYQRLFGWLGD
ncbi:MAG: hypothetical protein U5S82_14000 [Gammaproteobacteria bacterium]|nr:hypothetical protein [Gammaproteobacteria bacterium]